MADDVTGDAQEKFEEMSLTFIAEEIDIGFTLATFAATEYAQGRLEHAREVRGKAEAACAEAERRLLEAKERGWDVGAWRTAARATRAVGQG